MGKDALPLSVDCPGFKITTLSRLYRLVYLSSLIYEIVFLLSANTFDFSPKRVCPLRRSSVNGVEYRTNLTRFSGQAFLVANDALVWLRVIVSLDQFSTIYLRLKAKQQLNLVRKGNYKQTVCVTIDIIFQTFCRRKSNTTTTLSTVLPNNNKITSKKVNSNSLP